MNFATILYLVLAISVVVISLIWLSAAFNFARYSFKGDKTKTLILLCTTLAVLSIPLTIWAISSSTTEVTPATTPTQSGFREL